MDTLWNGDRHGTCALKRSEVLIRGLDIDWFAPSCEDLLDAIDSAMGWL